MAKMLIRTALLFLGILVIHCPHTPGTEKVTVERGAKGWELRVNGKPFYVKGITWSATPVGHKYDYNLYNESEERIKAAIDRDMTLFKAAGGNTLRALPPRKWADYIHKKYGMYFVLNEFCGRYGITVGGVWKAPTNYADPAVRKQIISNWKKLAAESKDFPGLLAYVLGNENNYGLEWKSAEVENLPAGERHTAKAKYLYSLFNEIAVEIKKIDPNHPVGIANGDVQYIDLIASLCPALDFFGANVYRGYTYSNLFSVVKEKLDKPIMLTETGCDAYNAVKQAEDQAAQGEFIYRNWADLYRNTAGNGGEGNSIGALAFQWADEWWKLGQSVRLRIHDTKASWRNEAYRYDSAAGNNMNEEWFGLCSIEEKEQNGAHLITPRASYFVLKDLWRLDPYTLGADKVKALKYDAAPYMKEAQAAAEGRETAVLPAEKPAKKAALPLYVYRENGEAEIWHPSGYMGDGAAITMNPGWTDKPHSGKTCMQVIFNKNNGWGGVFWQDPAGDWGDRPGGINLTGAKTLSFWLRGKKGGEKVKFGFGGIGAEKPHHDSAKGEMELVLTAEWKQYRINLAGMDMRKIKSGFLWTAAGQGAPVEFYLDDVVYE